jgi:hypothetical protein
MWGDLKEASDELGKVINSFHYDRLLNLMATAGGEIIYGGGSNRE